MLFSLVHRKVSSCLIYDFIFCSLCFSDLISGHFQSESVLNLTETVAMQLYHWSVNYMQGSYDSRSHWLWLGIHKEFVFLCLDNWLQQYSFCCHGNMYRVNLRFQYFCWSHNGEQEHLDARSDFLNVLKSCHVDYLFDYGTCYLLVISGNIRFHCFRSAHVHYLNVFCNQRV